jgi:hypothetical protein
MKDKYDTSEKFPDGTLKTDDEPPLLKTLNRMAGQIFKMTETIQDLRNQNQGLRKEFEELKRAVDLKGRP